MKKFAAHLFLVSTFALGIASAESPYTLTLADTFSVGKTELKAGDYTVEMQGDKAVFKIGKKTIQVPATLAKGDITFPATLFVSQRSKLKEIDFGGTQDKILFVPAGTN